MKHTRTMTQQNLTANAYDIHVVDPVEIGLNQEVAQKSVELAQSMGVGQAIHLLTTNPKNLKPKNVEKREKLLNAYLINAEVQLKFFQAGEKKGLLVPKVA